MSWSTYWKEFIEQYSTDAGHLTDNLLITASFLCTLWISKSSKSDLHVDTIRLPYHIPYYKSWQCECVSKRVLLRNIWERINREQPQSTNFHIIVQFIFSCLIWTAFYNLIEFIEEYLTVIIWNETVFMYLSLVGSLTWWKGQQLNSPVRSWQHVWPASHTSLLGHCEQATRATRARLNVTFNIWMETERELKH